MYHKKSPTFYARMQQDSIVPEVKARLNILDVVGSYVRLTKAGSHWKACCPFHNEKTPSFTVSEERQMFHCFGCGKGGDMFTFVEEIEGIGFREALELLAERAGVEVPAYRKSSVMRPGEPDRPDRGREILELATKFYEKQLWEGQGTKTVLPYLRKRGLSDESLRAFRVGYVPDGWRHIHDFLLSRGYEASELEAVGLVIAKEGGAGHYDRFRDRIMFPIMDVVGRVIGYSARVAPGGDEGSAKYINTPETALYRKSKAIYGISQAKGPIKDEGFTVLVEGQMDVIACHQAGFGNTVAASGTALTSEHLDILKRYAPEARLFFDMDSAGQEAAWRGALLALEKGMNVSLVSISSGKDAADLAVSDTDALRSAIGAAVTAPKYFLEHFLKKYDVSRPEGKKAVARAYAPLLMAMESDIDRDFWRKELASHIGADDRAVLSVLRQAETERTRETRYEHSESEDTGATVPDRAFSSRSEAVRNRLLGLLLLDPALVASVPSKGAIREALARDPLFSLIDGTGAGRVTDRITDEHEKTRAATLLFEAEREIEASDVSEFELAETRKATLLDLLKQLEAELAREEKTRLATEIEAARKAGDREREKVLLSRLSGRLED
jgi:DNA primase